MIFFVVVLALRFIVRLRFPTEVPISMKTFLIYLDSLYSELMRKVPRKKGHSLINSAIVPITLLSYYM